MSPWAYNIRFLVYGHLKGVYAFANNNLYIGIFIGNIDLKKCILPISYKFPYKGIHIEICQNVFNQDNFFFNF